ncbi:MAG: hypothetical protein J0I11_09835 [Actinobacteria bacterium]|nr:hypothetical protein [Actinomycetota bacterium]
MTMHGRPVRRMEGVSQTVAVDEPAAIAPTTVVGFQPAPLLGGSGGHQLLGAAAGDAPSRRDVLRRSTGDPQAPASPSPGVLRRVMLDAEAEEDVFDAAEGKRDAEVQNLSLDRLVSGKDHSALEKFVGARQAKGPQARPMAELRATRKIADNRVRKSVRSSVDSARAQEVVTGGGDRTGLEQMLGKKAERGPDFDTTQHLKDERRKRRAEARESYDTDLAKRNRAAGLEIQQAKQSVESKSKSMATVLKHGRAAMGTPDESFEMSQFVAALDAKNWKEALAALGHVESASTAALTNAQAKLAGRESDIAAVDTYPDYHRPTDLAERRKALDTAMANQEWPTIARQVTDFLAVVDLARGYASRLAKVEAETANLTNPERKNFMTETIAEHKKQGWVKIRDTAESSSKPALAFLETRLEEYQDKDLKEQASKEKASEAAAAATKDALAKKDAARKLRKERLDKGLLAGNETVIAEKKVSELTGPGEKEGVQATLDAIKAGTVAVLTHNNGKRWAYPHNNRDGDLPGSRGSGGYLEYYVEKDPASTTYHGDRRIVVHQATGRKYYTWTHYGENGSPPFVLITE